MTFQGSHYKLGCYLGARGREAFETIIQPGEVFRRLRRRLPNDWLNQVAGLIQAEFPRIWRELEGLAAGLGQPLEDVLLWNCRGDIAPTGPEGCSSIAVRTTKGGILAHNEDGDPPLREHCFMLEAAPDDEPAFASFCYPASIPGHTLGMNAAGLACTVNNIRLTECPVGTPRMVTARALLACDSVDSAVALLRETRRSGGYHFMMVDGSGQPPVSVEAPFHGVSCCTADPVAVHANHLIHDTFDGVPQITTASSGMRQRRLESWCKAQHSAPAEDALLTILGDRRDDPLSILRTDPHDPDEENTLATAIIESSGGGVVMKVMAGPQGPVLFDRTIMAAHRPPANAGDGNR